MRLFALRRVVQAELFVLQQGIHFGVMMVVNLAIGFVTPPIGVNLFVASSFTDIPVVDIAKRALPLIGYFLIALLLITFIPVSYTHLSRGSRMQGNRRCWNASAAGSSKL